MLKALKETVFLIKLFLVCLYIFIFDNTRVSKLWKKLNFLVNNTFKIDIVNKILNTASLCLIFKLSKFKQKIDSQWQ